MARVHWLGRKTYAELPRYVRGFDVGLIPFTVTPLTLAASPTKLFEYLASGLPVVSTPLPEAQRFGDVVAIAEPMEFEDAVSRALVGARDSRLRARRIALARRNDWRQRVDSILSYMKMHGVIDNEI